MTHDPYCPRNATTPPERETVYVVKRVQTPQCACEFIARVRADEREKADCPDPSICDRHDCAAAAAYCDGVADERKRAAERVAELGCNDQCGCRITIPAAMAAARRKAT